MSTIQTLWNEHRQAEFPEGLATKRVMGIDLLFLGANIASCVSAFLASGHSFDEDRLPYLRTCQRQSELVLESLEGSAFDHFTRLDKMARLILDELSERALHN